MDYNRLIKPLDNQINFSDDPLPKDRHLLWTICGMKGRGKTTLLMNALGRKEFFKGYFDNIYLISPTAKNDDKLKPLLKELIQEDKHYLQPTDDNLRTIMEAIKMYNKDFDKKKNKREPRNLLILDDCLHMLPKSTQKNSALNELITQNRHYKTSVYITTQSFKKLNSIIRSNVDCVSFFQSPNEHEKKNFCEEYGVDIDELNAICEKNNDFCHINWTSGKQLMYNGFNLIE